MAYGGFPQILWQGPLFGGDLGYTLISHFSFTPFSTRQAFALLGNFGLIDFPLILYNVPLVFFFPFIPFSLWTCTIVVLCLIAYFHQLNRFCLALK